jgi:hypothetical protein
MSCGLLQVGVPPARSKILCSCLCKLCCNVLNLLWHANESNSYGSFKLALLVTILFQIFRVQFTKGNILPDCWMDFSPNARGQSRALNNVTEVKKTVH